MSPNDLLRNFLRVAGNSLSRRGQREHLWSKVLSDTPNGRLADSGVKEKRFCIDLSVGFGPFAMASPTTPVQNPMVKTKLRRLAYCALIGHREASMSKTKRVDGPKRRGQTAKAQSATGLAEVARATSRLWRKHHLSYDQSKYVVERARRTLFLEPPRIRRRTVKRLDYPEVERLIRSAYRDRSAYGVMIKTLFLTGARVDEFVHIRVEDLHLDDDYPKSI